MRLICKVVPAAETRQSSRQALSLVASNVCIFAALELLVKIDSRQTAPADGTAVGLDFSEAR